MTTTLGKLYACIHAVTHLGKWVCSDSSGRANNSFVIAMAIGTLSISESSFCARELNLCPATSIYSNTYM